MSKSGRDMGERGLKVSGVDEDTGGSMLFGMGRKLFLFLLVTGFTCSYSILVQMSKVNDQYMYHPMTTVLMAEFTKLIISWVLFKRNQTPGDENHGLSFTLRGFATYGVPGVIYLVNNNLAFVALSYMGPPMYQLLSNMKIVSTALLFRIIIQKRLSNHQWAAVFLLVLGCSVPQLTALSKDLEEEGTDAAAASAHLITGFLLMCIISLLSGSAGVYTEYMLKRNPGSMHYKNIHLYLNGVVLNSFLMFFLPSSPINQGKGFFDGYDSLTVLVFVNLALNGMAISFIMRYADNIMKLYAGSVAMFLSMFLSVILFDFHFNPHIVMGSLIVCVSVFLYNTAESGR